MKQYIASRPLGQVQVCPSKQAENRLSLPKNSANAFQKDRQRGKRQVIDNGNIRAGDVIVALSSSGRATYEDSYNSGIGSNGLTAARHDTFKNSLAKDRSFENVGVVKRHAL